MNGRGPTPRPAPDTKIVQIMFHLSYSTIKSSKLLMADVYRSFLEFIVLRLDVIS